MKILSALLVVLSTQFALASSEEAAELYKKRDYTKEGAAAVEQAAKLYGEVAEKAAGLDVAKARVRQAEALYFLGTAKEDNASKMDIHWKGVTITSEILNGFGLKGSPEAITKSLSDAAMDQLKTTLSDDDKDVLGEALYYRAANIGKWGEAKGKLNALSMLNELKSNLRLIVKIGRAKQFYFGAYRIQGRVLAEVPGMLGGDLNESEKLLKGAFEGTLDKASGVSKHGTNTIFYAKTLIANSKEDQAKAILAAFVKADVNALEPNLIPENRLSQKEAADLLK